MLHPAHRRDINDPIIWRRLRDEQVGLTILFRDRTSSQWHAHAVSPWLDDDHLPYWAPEYDSRAYINATGPSAAAAVLALFDHPRLACPPVDGGLARATARLTVELALLIDVIRR